MPNATEARPVTQRANEADGRCSPGAAEIRRAWGGGVLRENEDMQG